MKKLSILLVIPLFLAFNKPQKKTVLVVNPYENVDWKNFGQFKANLHTHTNNSDGGFNAHEVVDTYAKNEYSILAITDHNLKTYPWTAFNQLNPKWENRDPKKVGLLTFPANELSKGPHRGMFFAHIDGGGEHIDSTFMQIQDSLALSMFYHPGRYWDVKKEYQPDEKYSISWFEKYLKRYPAIVGIEVFNTPYDRYPYDRILWDELLTRLMPQRPVWAYSNDDMHGKKELMGNYEFMLMPDLSISSLKKAMKTGAFYIGHEPGQSGKALAPRIDSIVVDHKNSTIKVFAKNYEQIKWISGVEGQGENRSNKIIKTGDSFTWTGFDRNYIRIELSNKNGFTLSQPFGFELK